MSFCRAENVTTLEVRVHAQIFFKFIAPLYITGQTFGFIIAVDTTQVAVSGLEMRGEGREMMVEKDGRGKVEEERREGEEDSGE